MFGTLGIQEILIVLVIGIIVFGVIKMPKIVRSLGSGVKQFQRFRDAIKNPMDHIDDFVKDEPEQNQQQYYGPNPNQKSPQWGGGGTNQQPGGFPGAGKQDQQQKNWDQAGPSQEQKPPGSPGENGGQKPTERGSDNA